MRVCRTDAACKYQSVSLDQNGLLTAVSGADLLVPTLVYFLVQANIPRLRSVITLMHDALEQTGLMKPDEEYLFVTVQSLVVEFPKFVLITTITATR